MDCSLPGSSIHGNSPGKNTGVGCHALLQGFFPTQGSNPGLPHCRQILYYLNNQGSLTTLEWVAYPFSRGTSWPRNWTGVSCIAGGFFTSWAAREDPNMLHSLSLWKQECIGDAPGDPVVKTGCFHCRGARVQSLVREQRSHTPHGTAEKKKRNSYVFLIWDKKLF